MSKARYYVLLIRQNVLLLQNIFSNTCLSGGITQGGSLSTISYSQIKHSKRYLAAAAFEPITL